MSAAVHQFPEIEKTLDACVIEWMQAKAQEDAANERRLQIEQRIVALAQAPEEGSTTQKLDNGFKLTVTGKLAYSCDDVQALITLARASNVPDNMVPVKTKVELDSTGAKFLRAKEPEVWRVLSKHITVKPAKTAVSVKV